MGEATGHPTSSFPLPESISTSVQPAKPDPPAHCPSELSRFSQVPTAARSGEPAEVNRPHSLPVHPKAPRQCLASPVWAVSIPVPGPSGSAAAPLHPQCPGLSAPGAAETPNDKTDWSHVCQSMKSLLLVPTGGSYGHTPTGLLSSLNT